MAQVLDRKVEVKPIRPTFFVDADEVEKDLEYAEDHFAVPYEERIQRVRQALSQLPPAKPFRKK